MHRLRRLRARLPRHRHLCSGGPARKVAEVHGHERRVVRKEIALAAQTGLFRVYRSRILMFGRAPEGTGRLAFEAAFFLRRSSNQLQSFLEKGDVLRSFFVRSMALLCLVLLPLSITLFPQSLPIEGTYTGTLQAGEAKLHLVLPISKTSSGSPPPALHKPVPRA